MLKALAFEPMHGFGVFLRIEQISDGVFRAPHTAIQSQTGENGRSRYNPKIYRY